MSTRMKTNKTNVDEFKKIRFEPKNRHIRHLLDFILGEETGCYNVQIIFKCVNFLNLHCFVLITNTNA